VALSRREDFCFVHRVSASRSEAKPEIYPSRGKIQIIKYNDKINFYSHYIFIYIIYKIYNMYM
jgi:hypothetical protein